MASTSLAGSPSAAAAAGNDASAIAIEAVIRATRVDRRTGLEWLKVRVQSDIENEPEERHEV